MAAVPIHDLQDNINSFPISYLQKPILIFYSEKDNNHYKFEIKE